MKSISFGYLDKNSFDDVYKYMLHLKGYNIIPKKLIVSPKFYQSILKSEFWYEVRLSGKGGRGFQNFELGNVVVKLIIHSLMDGNWCILTKTKDDEDEE